MPKIAEQSIFRRPGSRFWQLRWSNPDGVEVRKSSKTEDFEEAKKQLERLKSGGGLTFQEAVVRFFDTHRMSPKTRVCYLGSNRAWHLTVKTGDLMLHEVARPLIQRFVSLRLKTVSASTIRNDLAFMSSLIRFSAQLPGGPETNAIAMFDKRYLRRAEKRVKWLEPGQVEALLVAIPTKPFRLIALFGLEAGLRRKEILNLKWHQINDAESYILLAPTGTKNRRPRRVPLSGALKRALADTARKGADDWVFPNPDTGQPYYDLHHWWDDAVKRAKIDDFHFHDTRHHFASRFIQKGGRVEVLQKLLGHGSIHMSMGYADLAEGNAEEEFRRIDSRTPTD